jgi:hypothetical protein
MDSVAALASPSRTNPASISLLIDQRFFDAPYYIKRA